MCIQSGESYPADGHCVSNVTADVRGLVHLGKLAGGYFITNLLNNAIPFLVLPILTRFLAPDQFANVALFGFYLTLSNALISVSVPAVVEKSFFKREKKDIAALIGNSFLVVLFFSLLAMTFIPLLILLMPNSFPLGWSWMMTIPALSFASAVFVMGSTIIRNRKEPLLYGKFQIFQTMINLGLSLVLVMVFRQGWQGRVWGIVISHLISALLIYHYLKSTGYVSYFFSKKVIRDILSTVLPLIPDSFQSVMISQVGLFFIQFYFAKEVLGVYAVGYQIAYAMRLLLSTLALSWFPYLYEQLAKLKSINRIYITRLLLAMNAVLFVGAAFIMVFSGTILRVMADVKYDSAKDFIPWFTVGFFFQGLYLFLMPFLIQFEQQRYISMVSFLNMIIMIILNGFFVHFFGSLGVAYAFAVIHVFMFLAFAWKTQQVFPLPWLRACKIWN